MVDRLLRRSTTTARVQEAAQSYVTAVTLAREANVSAFYPELNAASCGFVGRQKAPDWRKSARRIGREIAALCNDPENNTPWSMLAQFELDLLVLLREGRPAPSAVWVDRLTKIYRTGLTRFHFESMRDQLEFLSQGPVASPLDSLLDDLIALTSKAIE